MTGPRDVEVYKAFGEEQITRRYNGKKERPFRNFKEKLKPANGGNGLKKITSKYNNWQDRVRKSEERKSALAKSAGLELKGTFEQRRLGRDKGGNKAACFERGGTDRLKATCPAWAFKKTEDVRASSNSPKPK